MAPIFTGRSFGFGRVDAAVGAVGAVASGLYTGSAFPILNTSDTAGQTLSSGVRSDANASSLILALPMNGSNNGTTFTDQSPTGRTSSTKSFSTFGNAKTVISQYKFYGSSASFDGSGDQITTPSSSDFAIKQSDFTIEMWVYPNTVSNGNVILSLGSGGSTLYWTLNLNSSSALAFGSGSGGWDWESGGDPGSLSSSSNLIPINTWTHIAVQRTGTSLVYYVNGVLSFTRTSAPFGGATQGGTFYIGSYFNNYNVDGSWFNGYIQDLRIYKNLAKYTSNFTP